jgi:stage II sporulation protein D
MKIVKHTILLLLITLSTQSWADTPFSAPQKSKKQENIQVLLNKDIPEVLLEVKGPYYVYDPLDHSKISSGLFGKRYIIRATKSGIKWGEEFPGIHQIFIAPRSTETSILVNGIQYDGAVAIYKVGNRINVVNELSVENYIKSILTTTITTPFDTEVLAAIAIAARTTAYYYAIKHQNAFWHINATDVGYQGMALLTPNSSIVKAVDSTKNLILVHPQEGKNLPFVATWNEHSAGATAPYHVVFRKDDQAPKDIVKAPLAALDRKESKWNTTLLKQQVANALNLKKIENIELYVDKQSGKTYAVRIKTEEDTQDMDFLKFQEKLGKNVIQSNDLSVSIIDNKISFSGYGTGHGVGLCLYSASAMAQNGDIAVKILSKFFPETFLINLSAIPNIN